MFKKNIYIFYNLIFYLDCPTCLRPSRTWTTQKPAAPPWVNPVWVHVTKALQWEWAVMETSESLVHRRIKSHTGQKAVGRLSDWTDERVKHQVPSPHQSGPERGGHLDAFLRWASAASRSSFSRIPPDPGFPDSSWSLLVGSCEPLTDDLPSPLRQKFWGGKLLVASTSTTDSSDTTHPVRDGAPPPAPKSESSFCNAVVFLSSDAEMQENNAPGSAALALWGPALNVSTGVGAAALCSNRHAGANAVCTTCSAENRSLHGRVGFPVHPLGLHS